jgi:hypothetical protein
MKKEDERTFITACCRFRRSVLALAGVDFDNETPLGLLDDTGSKDREKNRILSKCLACTPPRMRSVV